MSPPNNPPAFPQFTTDSWNKPVVHGGLSLRDYFAGQALAGIAANDNYSEKQTAELCYQIADFMLTAREPQPDTATSQQIALGIGGGK